MITIKNIDIKSSKQNILNQNSISAILNFISCDELSKAINTIQDLSNKNLFNEQKRNALKEEISKNNSILQDFSGKIIDEIAILARHQNHYFGTDKINWFGKINETESIKILKRNLGLPKSDDTFRFIGNSILDDHSKEKFYPLVDYIAQPDVNREELLKTMIPTLNQQIHINGISINPETKEIQIHQEKNQRQNRFYSNELNLRINQYSRVHALKNIDEKPQIYWIGILNTCMGILSFGIPYFQIQSESYFEKIKKLILEHLFKEKIDQKPFEAACKVFFAKKIDWSFFDDDLTNFLN